MGTLKTWRHKLDPQGRMRLEEGIPVDGIDVTVRLTSKDTQRDLELAAQGLNLHSQVDEIIVGHVLSSVLILVGFIRRTTPKTSLKVTATCFEQTYLTGLKVSKAEFKNIQLTRHDVCPKWNYTMRPHPEYTE